MLHSKDDLYLNSDLMTYLPLTMNIKVVHNGALDMFKLIARSHTHFMHWSHIGLSSSTHIASLKYWIRQNDLHEHCSTSHHKCS